MASRLRCVTIDVRDHRRVAGFWAEVLGRGVVEDGEGSLLPGDDGQVGLRFALAPADTGNRRLHLHVTSDGPADQDETVAAALELGASPLDVGQRPQEGHVVLADPGGNALCVIEPDNAFLAGCGLLGEVACEGTREVGVFWSDALGWPLVWDQDGETAIQSPDGGTKVAWGGPPVAPKDGPNSQRFELVADGDVAGEVDRLVALGATRGVGDQDGAVLMADPDGNEFTVTAP